MTQFYTMKLFVLYFDYALFYGSLSLTICVYKFYNEVDFYFPLLALTLLLTHTHKHTYKLNHTDSPTHTHKHTKTCMHSHTYLYILESR
jgi:hypothetical protein